MLSIDKLQHQIDQSKTEDRGRFIDQLIKIKQLYKQKSDPSKKIINLGNALAKSVEKVRQKQSKLPNISYPDLPISIKANEIKQAIVSHQVIIVAGETGSGKSTQLPKICLDMGRGSAGFIGHTQPRRLAARSVAARIAEETNTVLGDKIGYKIRFSDKTSENTYVKLMTDGILLAEIQQDKFLSKYDTIIIDEAHERSLNIDFLLGFLKQLMQKRKDLKIIITSATIDHQRFSQHFNNAPIIEVSGRSYPVEMRYRDYNEEQEEDLSQPEVIRQAIDELSIHGRGDILVFLATQREIMESFEFLQKVNLPHTEIVTLFASLSQAEQQKIFNNHSGRRVILATNVAETSITVPGVRYVIDTGKVRISRYSYRTKVQRLPIEAISKASADQRAGRCGRVAPGVCIRLYSEEDDYLLRSAYTDPEILRTNLAAVILQMEALRLGKIESFPFIEAPDNRYIKDGYRLLHELNALDQKNIITDLGHILAKFPIDPKLARMLVAANKYKSMQELLVVVSFLSIQDPRERPQQFQQKSAEVHRQDKNDKSDFLSIVNLWNRYQKERLNLSNKQLKRYCHRNFLAFLRMREWLDIYRQLEELVIAQKWNLNKEPASYENMHKCLATGLLSHIGFNYAQKEYLGARGLKFYIFPGSSQFKANPKWLIASELVETTKLYARQVAKISPEWLEPLAGHLVKKHYSEPYWSKNKSAVLASERVTLYGLEIIAKRSIFYANIDPVISRELFIRHALVYGEFITEAPFFKKNLALLEEIEELEHKSRRRDVLVDDETLVQYYEKLIPKEVVGGISFKKWYQQLTKEQQQQLIFHKEDLMQHDATNITQQKFPDIFSIGELKLPLSYSFDPTAGDDGVTMRIPVPLLDQIHESATEWLVPGMLEEKIIALMRALPKSIRKSCVPIPYYAKAIMESIDYDPSKNLKGLLVKHLTRITGVQLDIGIWDQAKIDKHFQMNFSVIDKNGEQLAHGRDISFLRDSLKGEIKKITVNLPKSENFTRNGLTKWDFGELKEFIQIKQYGVMMTMYPCLKDMVDSVDLITVASLDEANTITKAGIIRLLQIACKYMQKMILEPITKNSKISLLFTKLVTKDELQEDYLACVFKRSFHVNIKDIRNESGFNKLLEEGKENLVPVSIKLVTNLATIMEEYQKLKKIINCKNIPFDLLDSYQSIKIQIDSLIYKGFISSVPEKWFNRLHIYLKMLQKRVDKMPRNQLQDKAYTIEIENLNLKLEKKIKQKDLSLNMEEVTDIQWLLQELWVSWYAQEFKTIESVSVQRIEKKIIQL